MGHPIGTAVDYKLKRARWSGTGRNLGAATAARDHESQEDEAQDEADPVEGPAGCAEDESKYCRQGVPEL